MGGLSNAANNDIPNKIVMVKDYTVVSSVGGTSMTFGSAKTFATTAKYIIGSGICSSGTAAYLLSVNVVDSKPAGDTAIDAASGGYLYLLS